MPGNDALHACYQVVTEAGAPHSDLTGRYLVFGASGYIGSNLVPFLRHYPVTVRAAA